jgi:hypothetical protein
MILKESCGIQGKFKFDIYTKDNKLKHTTDYISNFITSTGLSYIHNYAFADCFRYLSLGTSNTANNITSKDNNASSPTFNLTVGTTGLSSPHTSYQYLGGSATNCSDASYDVNNYVAAGCGYRIQGSGVTLNRAWRVPQTEDTYFTAPVTFKEYMLSPGRTGITGHVYNAINDNWDDIGNACACNEYVRERPDDGDVIYYGKEDWALKDYYPQICQATKAFARIIKDLAVETDEYLVVNYALTVNLNTGVNAFKVAIDSNEPVDLLEYYLNFAEGTYVSGYYSLVHPGIKLINNGNVTDVTHVSQIPSFTLRVGESFVPPLGQAMEPSCPLEFRYGYISNDNYQFKVNDLLGGAYKSTLYKPDTATGRWFPSGTIGFHENYIEDCSNNAEASLGAFSYLKPYFHKPRSELVDTIGASHPDMTDYTTSVLSTALTDSVYHPVYENQFTVQIVEPAKVTDGIGAADQITLENRTRTKTVDFQFQPLGGLVTTGESTAQHGILPYRAFVYAYKYPDEADQWYANVDTIIHPYTFDNDFAGKQPIQGPNKTAKTYPAALAPVTKIGGVATTGHYYQDDQNILQMQLRIGWSAPCPSEVGGCPP